jgi:hypothetical protein
MKKDNYRVIFIDFEQIELWAGSQKQAEILAQAERIKAGKIYEVNSVEVIS